MHRSLLLTVICASFTICAHIFAQDPPPTRVAVEAALAQQSQKRAAIHPLENQTSALARAITLLSRDPADQPYLATIRSMLAESKRQLEATNKEYEAAQAVLRDAVVPKPRP